MLIKAKMNLTFALKEIKPKVVDSVCKMATYSGSSPI